MQVKQTNNKQLLYEVKHVIVLIIEAVLSAEAVLGSVG